MKQNWETNNKSVTTIKRARHRKIRLLQRQSPCQFLLRILFSNDAPPL